ncbi:hypothetical protein CEXT_289161 [Caerostris extrusa]|uniref:Uncharacterized protein n=1 Tax=Caerostris extrusa TaxID=172846 RepID=A0AAV4RK05_CAEEX|nr:hypothetical protein CEXT_289161 [Caerostris extrusa]
MFQKIQRHLEAKTYPTEEQKNRMKKAKEFLFLLKICYAMREKKGRFYSSFQKMRVLSTMRGDFLAGKKKRVLETTAFFWEEKRMLFAVHNTTSRENEGIKYNERRFSSWKKKRVLETAAFFLERKRMLFALHNTISRDAVIVISCVCKKAYCLHAVELLRIEDPI